LCSRCSSGGRWRVDIPSEEEQWGTWWLPYMDEDGWVDWDLADSLDWGTVDGAAAEVALSIYTDFWNPDEFTGCPDAVKLALHALEREIAKRMGWDNE
jgi:hypothetical protein